MKIVLLTIIITTGIIAMEEQDYYGKYTVISNEDSQTISKVVGTEVVINDQYIIVDGVELKWKFKEVRPVGSHVFLTGETNMGFAFIQKVEKNMILAVTLGPTVVLNSNTTKWTGEILTLSEKR
jgi:hypothetical protein